MSVKVAVRVRPFNSREKFLGCLNCIQMKDKTTILINPRDRSQKEHQFTFDYSLWSHDGFEELQNGYLYPIDDRFIDQKRIFKELGEDIIKSAWNGFNCCLFAYGQTGAGKSYSMIGYQSNHGIVPMACQKIFEGIEKNRVKGKKEFEVTISMLEIYNEKVQDLLIHTSRRPANGLKIRENKRTGIYVEGITRYLVDSYADIEKKMDEGSKNRSLASTLMNEYSSRAHTIVMIEFIQKQFITEQKMNKKTSLLNLVDLAGSERLSKTGINDKDRMKEASQINKSLHTLGRVIEQLAEQSANKGKVVQVPYRESALTRILETALGGNSVTTMICAISPANDNYEETLSTLRYADQTKKIKNRPIINESAVDKIIRQLREENERLKQMLRIAKLKGLNIEQHDGNIIASIQQIQRQIRKNMQSFAINTDELDNEDDIDLQNFVDVQDPNDFYAGELSFESSITTVGNLKANAFITNLSEDKLLSFKIKYSCEEQLYIGNKNLKEGGKNRLILCGLGVEDRHARVYQINNKYYIQPLSEQASEYTLVNGKPIQSKTEIKHNDRLIFGTNSVFLFKNLNSSNCDSPSLKSKAMGVTAGTSRTLQKRQSMKMKEDQDQSMLLDWDDDEQMVNQSSVTEHRKQYGAQIGIGNGHGVGVGTGTQIETVASVQGLNEKDIDYQFAINERQNKMFETSTSVLSSSIQANDMAQKLEDIEKQFSELVRQNERKMKQKEQMFREELKRLEIEREIEKAKMKEELLMKQEEAKKINLEKERIERIRDRLIQLEKDRREREKAVRESILLVDMEDEPEKTAVPNATGQVPPSPEPRIEYINQHYFHYDYNVVQSQELKDEYEGKMSEPSINTTATTQMNGDCADDTNQRRQAGMENANMIKKKVLEPNDAKGPQKEAMSEIDRKRSLSLTDIIYGPLLQSSQQKPKKSSMSSEEEQNLLNMTNDYLPQRVENRRMNSQESYINVSLNLSDCTEDLQSKYQVKQEELNQKIQELEKKLRELESSKQEKESTIKSIRKSFTVQFGERPNSDNFFIEGMEEDFDLSLIQTRKNSSDMSDATELEKRLKQSMVQCQNQNIINERNLQVRKRKREADELKDVFVKKEKRELQKQLIVLIPMLEKFNLWARQMSRNLEGKIHIEYKNFTNYEIVEALKNHSYKINLQVNIINYGEGRTYRWPIEVFKNRYEIVESLFQQFLENPAADYVLFTDKNRDPFWQPRQFQGFGVAYLSLEPLCYFLQYSGQISIVHKSQVIGYLQVSLTPTVDAAQSKLRQKLFEMTQNDEEIHDPRQLLEKDIFFKISIDSFRPTEHLELHKISQYFISYEILEDKYKVKQYKTRQMSIHKGDIGYEYKHSLRGVTEHILAYLADSPICFTFNALFEYNDELSLMTSSFIQNSESSLNLSSLSDRSPVSQSVLNDSPPPFAKKKAAVIVENLDILSKLDRDYNSEIKKRSKEKLSSSIVQASSGKKKDKGKEDCIIF